MLVPMILVYVLWKYLPMYELTAAFRYGDYELTTDRPWAGISNFQNIYFGANAAQFWQAFRNTFIIAFYGLLFGFPMPIILALFFNEVKSNIARSIMQVCVYLPKFISTVIVTSLTLALFSGNAAGGQIGVVSQLVGKIFKSSKMLQASLDGGLVYTIQYFRPIYIITDIWEHAGYDSIVFFAAVIAVSPTSYEAAQIDGAGKMAQMRYVVIPSILSTVVIMLIMKIGGLLSTASKLLNIELNAKIKGYMQRAANTIRKKYAIILNISSLTSIFLFIVFSPSLIQRHVGSFSCYRVCAYDKYHTN